ncbi:ras-related protein O-RAL-like [Sycon ciliatum]|uniref:ras-related protein O-RAL-like n=1 Tax=Sycon ciliatum TaxID=27933 RepID=UPI0020AEC226|eukprot:scpid97241/ scgid24853/ Ras-related protein Ral-B
MPGGKSKKKKSKTGTGGHKNGVVDQEYYQILLLGVGGVGKSSLVLQLVFNEFHDEYRPSEVDNYQAQVEADGIVSRVDVLDTSGQEEYALARDSYIRNSMGFLAVFSIAEQDSFDALPELVDAVRRVKRGEDAPIIVVGNKSDLKEQRVVWESQGRDYAESNHLIYFETSAKTSENVTPMFVELVRQMRATRAAAAAQNGAVRSGGHGGRRRRCVIL